MASAAIWLDELGIPPREICLDWAWQIQSRFARARKSTPIAPLDWQRIEVGDDGKLLLPADFDKYSPDARLQELLSWSQGHDGSLASNAIDERVNIEAELRRLTVDCVTKVATVRSRNSQRSLVVSIDEPVQEPTQTDSTTPSNNIANNIEPLSLPSKNLRRPAKVKRSKSSMAPQFIAVCKRHKLATASVGVTLVATCILAFSFGTGSTRLSKPIEVANRKSDVGDEAVTISQDSDVDERAALATIPVMPQPVASEPEVQEVLPIQLPTISSVAISGRGRQEDPAASTVNEEHSLQDNAAPKNSPSIATRNEPATPNDTELTDRDVMQELEVMTKAATNNAIETDLNVAESKDDNAISEPFTLHTSPMVQTHKLAAKIKVRPRQPVWQIVLAVDDEFELSPKEPQDISDRQPTTWILTNTDSKSPQVRLVIQAQAAPARQTALRWRIFASAEDLPDLMLPLDNDMLSPLQDRLRFYAQASQREADRMKQLASVAERDMRNTLSKQRVFMESQSKLASRLITVVAEAQLMDDLLRSQLTVYAKLRDGSEADAPTLLQFGDLRNLEKVPEVTEPEGASK